MPPRYCFDCSLKAIHALVKELIDPAFLYSDFDATKDALASLVALEIICSNFTLDPQSQQLNETQQQTLLWEGTTRRFEISFSNYLSVCYKALESLLNSKTGDDYAFEKYLFGQLINALQEADKNQLTDIELAKNIARIEIHIKFNILLNNFFQYLKALNKTELQDKGLANLLSKLDSYKGSIFSAEKLAKGPLALLEKVRLYLAKKIIYVVTNERQSRKKAFLLEFFEQIKEIKLIIRSQDQLQKESYQAKLLSFTEVNHSKINALFKQYTKQAVKRKASDTFEVLAETPQSIEASPERLSLNALKSLFAMQVWNTQAKATLGKTVPQGIKEIREILNDETLSVERSFVAMMVVVAQRLEKPIDARNLIVHQLYIELKRNVFAKYFSDLYEAITNHPDSIKTEQYQEVAQILTAQSSLITDAVAAIQDKTATSLKETIQRMPTTQIKELLTKLCEYFPNEKQLRNNKVSLELKGLLSKLSRKITENNTEGKLEVIKDFISLYVFLKHKMLLHNGKAIKAKDYLLYKDLFDTLGLVINAFRDNGYQALLDKLYCHKDLHGRKLLAALQRVDSDKVMASSALRSMQDLFPMDKKIESALTKASTKLNSLVPYSQRWLGSLANTSLGETLSLFKEEVQKKSKESFFVPTGIKQLKRLFEKWDSRSPLDLSGNKAVIELLNDIINILEKRLERNSKRSRLLQRFYTDKLKEFTELRAEAQRFDETSPANRDVGDTPLYVASDVCGVQETSLQERQEQNVFHKSGEVLPIQSRNGYTFFSSLTSSTTASSRSSSPSSSGYGSSSEIKFVDETETKTSCSSSIGFTPATLS